MRLILIDTLKRMIKQKQSIYNQKKLYQQSVFIPAKLNLVAKCIVFPKNIVSLHITERRIMTERELITSLKMGDEDAFTALYKIYWPKVHNFSRLYLTSVSEVEEIVQEVFVKVWEARLFLKEDESFKGLLFIITRNIIFNQFRKSFNENAYKTTVLNSANTEYDIENEMEASDLQAYITTLISELPPRQKEIFKMSREQHLSYKEISLRLNISEKTVERHINEALKYLRRNIYLLSIFLSI